jgi:hypothetical protein
LRQATTSLALASDSTASTSAPKSYEEENLLKQRYIGKKYYLAILFNPDNLVFFGQNIIGH